jgi:hypothetical protein
VETIINVLDKGVISISSQIRRNMKEERCVRNSMGALVVGLGPKVCQDLRKGKTSYRSTKTLSMSLSYVCDVINNISYELIKLVNSRNTCGNDGHSILVEYMLSFSLFSY